jgi:hypothetical protein
VYWTESAGLSLGLVHVQGNLIGSLIQSGSPGAQQEMTVRDINSESTAGETLSSESKRAHPWQLILTIAVAGLGAAVTTILGVSRLSWWSLAIFVFVAGAVLAAVTYAITEKKHRTLALSVSNGLCGVLLIGIGLYHLIGPSPARTANVIANKVGYAVCRGWGICGEGAQCNRPFERAALRF